MSNATTTFTGKTGKKSLKIQGQDLDLDAELAKFEAEERKRLGLDGQTEQWLDDMVNLQFTRKERDNVTLLIGGLTLAHDYLIEGALKGIGYNVEMLNVPDTAAFQAGKEFGNRGGDNTPRPLVLPVDSEYVTQGGRPSVTLPDKDTVYVGENMDVDVVSMQLSELDGLPDACARGASRTGLVVN